MVRYNFKNIACVPNNAELIDIVLSKTQRKTPTIVHPKYPIPRIREFYMRKVRFTQQTINDKLSAIIDSFPRLEDLHPFFADLLHIMYEKNHYKIALGELNICRQKIAKLGSHYLQLLKFGDSAFRCKRLKVACLGRMVSLLKQLKGLKYLEKVRLHLALLPNINPFGRMIVLCGFPNAGKSSFLRNVSNCKIEVENYAFTTKSLYVGHFYHESLQFQVIDTPGLLDRSLKERNLTELQSINALAHLFCTVCFFMDVSPQSSFSLKEQIDLFNSLTPLFKNKPVMILLTKTDLIPNDNQQKKEEYLSGIRKQIQQQLKLHANNYQIREMSNISKEGIETVKHDACEMLIQNRVQYKMNRQSMAQGEGEGENKSILDKIYVACPKGKNLNEFRSETKDDIVPPFLENYKLMTDPENEKMKDDGKEEEEDEEKDDEENELEGGKIFTENSRVKKRRKRKETEDGDVVHPSTVRKFNFLEKEEWNYDEIPEIYEGKNVLDFYDEELPFKLQKLRSDEKVRQEKRLLSGADVEEEIVSEDIMGLFKEIETKKKEYKLQQALKKRTGRVGIPRKYQKLDILKKNELMNRGVDKEVLENISNKQVKIQNAEVQHRSKSRKRSLSRRSRSMAAEGREMLSLQNDILSSSVVSNKNRSTSQMRNLKNELGNDGQERVSKSVLGKRKRDFGDLEGARFGYGTSKFSGGIKDPREQVRAVLLGFKRRKSVIDSGNKFTSDRVFYDYKPKHLFSGKTSFKRERR